MNETASVIIYNQRDHPVNISLSAPALVDNGGRMLDIRSLGFPLDVYLEPHEEKTVEIVFSGENASYGTYATILDIVSAEDRVRLPILITIPLLGEGVIEGSVGNYCSEKIRRDVE